MKVVALCPELTPTIVARSRLRMRAWAPFDWQKEWGRVAFRSLGQCYRTSLRLVR